MTYVCFVGGLESLLQFQQLLLIPVVPFWFLYLDRERCITRGLYKASVNYTLLSSFQLFQNGRIFENLKVCLSLIYSTAISAKKCSVCGRNLFFT